MRSKFYDIVFAAPPGPANECVFVECEDDHGRGVRLGDWIEREDGHWVLRVRMDCEGCPGCSTGDCPETDRE